MSERLCKVIPIADLGLANNRCSELKNKPETSKNLYHSPDYHFNRLTNYCINNVESEGIFRKKNEFGIKKKISGVDPSCIGMTESYNNPFSIPLVRIIQITWENRIQVKTSNIIQMLQDIS